MEIGLYSITDHLLIQTNWLFKIFSLVNIVFFRCSTSDTQCILTPDNVDTCISSL